MEKNYRITFSDERGENFKSIDVYAIDSDDAFSQAYRMPEAKSGKYTGVLVEKLTPGPNVYGIEFDYFDTAFKKNFTGYMCIKSNC